MDLAEREVDHRHAMERDQLKKSYRAHLFGQFGGFLLAVLIIIAGAWLVSEDHGVAGFGTLLLGAAGLISAALNRPQSN